MTDYTITPGRHATRIAVSDETWRDSLLDLFTTATTEQLLGLQTFAQQAEDRGLDEREQEAAVDWFTLILRDLYPRPEDLPLPAAHIDHNDIGVFFRRVDDAALAGRRMSVPPYNVPCEECGAAVGDPCAFPDGVIQSTHIKRWRAAKAAAGQKRRAAS